MSPKKLSIADFTYHLPDEQIAKYPLEQRDSSKLLVYKSGKITASSFSDIDAFLPGDTLLVFNNTRVIEARLLFEKSTGGVIEIFCLEPDKAEDPATAMAQKGKALWKCLVGGASKWKHGIKLRKTVREKDREVVVDAAITGRQQESFIIELSWQPAELTFAEMLHAAGFIPLPPYLHRSPEEDDKRRYQTIYAQYDGSVAAPTAGLHFTQRIFDRLALKNIQKEFVTLHVGAGTFKPVKSDTMHEHEMHAEFIDISEAAIQNILHRLGETIVAIGTTSLRTIESLYWMGVKVIANRNITIDKLEVAQWEPYDLKSEISSKEALESLLAWMKEQQVSRLISRTRILIAPEYKLKVAKGLITNFHQPRSTLLLLVAAIVGSDWKNIYNYALENDFRFLSYGDACLLWRNSY